MNYKTRPQIALNIGGLIADGFIAVEAQDTQQVKNIGGDIVKMAKALGVSDNRHTRKQHQSIRRQKPSTDRKTNHPSEPELPRRGHPFRAKSRSGRSDPWSLGV